MKKDKPRSVKNKRTEGFILIATYLIVMLVSMFSFAYFARANAFLQASERNRNKIIAFNMAESAADFALAQLAANPAYTGTATFVPLSSGSAQGGFTVTVTTPTNNPNIRMIQASGFSPSNVNTSRAYQASAVTTYGRIQPNSLFNFGVFAQDSISLTGNAVVDSYDSRNGAYGGTNRSSNGDIGTNSIVSQSVTLSGNALIKGDAVVGPSGNPGSVIRLNGNAAITGTSTAAAQASSYPAPTTTLPSSGALNISGNNTTYLMPGTYHYSSISITGNGKLSLTGPVTIYVDGDVNLAGNGVATQNNVPTNFMLMATGSETVKVSGNGNFYGAIYAPNAPVKNTGNGSIFGAVIAQDYDQTGNGSVHFDEALKDVQGTSGSGRLAVTAWQEQNSLTWGT